MGRGGKREGSGRKKSSLTVRTRKTVERHEAAGHMMPLDVMLKAMMLKADAGDWDGAAEHAKNAAPYSHPKLQAVEHSGDKDNPIAITFGWED